MCSWGRVTLQPIYCCCRLSVDQIHRLTVHRSHYFRFAFHSSVVDLYHHVCSFSFCHWERVTVRTTQQACRFCPLGSVTGICPCRMKECRVWLVTEPRGHNPLQKLSLLSLFLALNTKCRWKKGWRMRKVTTFSSILFWTWGYQVTWGRPFFITSFLLCVCAEGESFLILSWFDFIVFNMSNKIS